MRNGEKSGDIPDPDCILCIRRDGFDLVLGLRLVLDIYRHEVALVADRLGLGRHYLGGTDVV